MIILGQFFLFLNINVCCEYSKTCVRQPPLKLTLVVDVKRWLSCKGTCHVILLMYLYKTDNFFHINHYLKLVSKVVHLHKFYCTHLKARVRCFKWVLTTYVSMENWRKLSQNYRQILLLNKSSGCISKYPFAIIKFIIRNVLLTVLYISHKNEYLSRECKET